MKVSYIYLHCRRRSHEQPHEHQTSMDDGGQEGGQGGRRSGVFLRWRFPVTHVANFIFKN